MSSTVATGDKQYHIVKVIDIARWTDNTVALPCNQGPTSEAGSMTPAIHTIPHQRGSNGSTWHHQPERHPVHRCHQYPVSRWGQSHPTTQRRKTGAMRVNSRTRKILENKTGYSHHRIQYTCVSWKFFWVRFHSMLRPLRAPEARTGSSLMNTSSFLFFYFFSGRWPLLPVQLSGVDDGIVWGACQTANHRLHASTTLRPSYGRQFHWWFQPPLSIIIYSLVIS